MSIYEKDKIKKLINESIARNLRKEILKENLTIADYKKIRLALGNADGNPKAQEKAIKKVYRQLLQIYHTDKNPLPPLPKNIQGGTPAEIEKQFLKGIRSQSASKQLVYLKNNISKYIENPKAVQNQMVNVREFSTAEQEANAKAAAEKHIREQPARQKAAAKAQQQPKAQPKPKAKGPKFFKLASKQQKEALNKYLSQQGLKISKYGISVPNPAAGPGATIKMHGGYDVVGFSDDGMKVKINKYGGRPIEVPRSSISPKIEKFMYNNINKSFGLTPDGKVGIKKGGPVSRLEGFWKDANTPRGEEPKAQPKAEPKTKAPGKTSPGPSKGAPKTGKATFKMPLKLGKYYAFTPEGDPINRPYSNQNYKGSFGDRRSKALLTQKQAKIPHAQRNIHVYRMVKQSSRNVTLRAVDPLTGKFIEGVKPMLRRLAVFGNPTALKAKNATWFQKPFNPLTSGGPGTGLNSIERLIKDRSKALADGRTGSVKSYESALKARGIDISTLSKATPPPPVKAPSKGGGLVAAQEPTVKSDIKTKKLPALIDPKVEVTKANKSQIIKQVKQLPQLKGPVNPAPSATLKIIPTEQLAKDVVEGKIKVPKELITKIGNDPGFRQLEKKILTDISKARALGHVIPQSDKVISQNLKTAIVASVTSEVEKEVAKAGVKAGIPWKTPGWKVPLGGFTGGFLVGLGLGALVKWYNGVPVSELITLNDVGVNLGMTYIFMKFPFLGTIALWVMGTVIAGVGGYYLGTKIHNYMKGDLNDVFDTLTQQAKYKVGELIGPSNYDRDKFKNVLRLWGGPVGVISSFFVKGSTKESDLWRVADEKGYPNGILAPKDVDVARRDVVLSVLIRMSDAKKTANELGGEVKNMYMDRINKKDSEIGKLNSLFRSGALNQKAWYNAIKQKQKEGEPEQDIKIEGIGGIQDTEKGEEESAVKGEDKTIPVKKMERNWQQYIDNSKNKENAIKIATGWYHLKTKGAVNDTSFKTWVKFYNKIRNDKTGLKAMGLNKKAGSHLSPGEVLKAYEFIASGDKAISKVMTDILKEEKLKIIKNLIRAV